MNLATSCISRINLRLLAVITFCIGFAIQSPAACTPAPAGLVSWWKAEGNFLDVMGANSGETRNLATFAPGKVGQAFNFNGVDQYVLLTNSPSLNPTGSFTIEAWIHPNREHMGDIIGKWGGEGDYANNRSYILAVTPDSGLVFAISDEAHQWDPAFHDFVVTNVVFAGSWSHVAAVYDQTDGTRRIYVNGTKVAERRDLPITVFNGIAHAAIGADLRSSTSPNFHFDGLIDELGFYHRALSEAEIKDIFSAGTEGKCVEVASSCVPAPAGLVSWWKAEDNFRDVLGVNSGETKNLATFAPGKVGQAFSFNGVDQHIVLTNSPALNPTGSFTIEAWIYPNEDHGGKILGKWGDDGDYFNARSYHFAVAVNSGLSFAISDLNHQWDPSFHSFSVANVIPPKTWSHVAAVYDQSTGTRRIYVNGLQVAERTDAPITVLNGNANAAIGADLPSSTKVREPFNGKIDELGFYHRALSQSELRAIFNAGTEGKCLPLLSSCVGVPKDVIGWWRAEGDNNDAIGTNYGILQNGATFADGIVGQAFHFDGINDSFRIHRDVGTNITTEFTIEFWMKASPGNVIGESYQGLVSSDFYGIGISTVYPRIGVQVYASTNNGASFVHTADINKGGAVFPENEWHHIAGTYDGTKLQLYVDGQPYGVPSPLTGPISPMTANGYISVGSEDGRPSCPSCVGSRYFAGDIDELAIYKRALTPAEIGEIYSSGAVGKCVPPPCVPPPSGLVSWWKGEENAIDEVGVSDGFLKDVSFASGQVGTAFSFNGYSSSVNVTNDGSLNFENAITIDFWMRPEIANSMLSDQGLVTTDFYCIEISRGRHWNDAYGVNFGISSDGGGYFAMTSDGNGGGARVSAGQWHHVAGTYDGSKLQLYINGEPWGNPVPASGPISRMLPDSFLSIGSEEGRNYCPPCVAGRYFQGAIDEVTLFNRALTAEEIKAVYMAGSAGKCTSTFFAPVILEQPSSQSAFVGSTVSFSVAVSGSAPLIYQWQFEEEDMPAATNTTLVLNEVAFTNAGSYRVLVKNVAGTVSSSSAVLSVVYPPAAVRVKGTTVGAGRLVTVPIELRANGNESALGFSLNFDRTVLSFVELNSEILGASLLLNTNEIATRLGVALSMPPGTTFTPGTQTIASVTFLAAIRTLPASTTISFGDLPIKRQIADSRGLVVPSSFESGVLTITPAEFEADLSPRPNGDRDLTVSDWVMVGRFATKLEVPEGTEFARIDCAPRATLGDGLIGVTDWVQAGRYAARLDPFAVVGGPAEPAPLLGLGGRLGDEVPDRALRIANTLLFQDQTVIVPVYLESEGGENALGFSIEFDATVLSCSEILLGASAAEAALQVNITENSSGRVAAALALPAGNVFPAGTKEVARLRFLGVGTASGEYPVMLTDHPVRREFSDADASPLEAQYINGLVSVNPVPGIQASRSAKSLTLTWPLWGTNFVLQEATGPLSKDAQWSDVSATATQTQEANILVLPIEEQTSKFYRLLKR